MSCDTCKRDTTGEITWPGGDEGAEICQECWEAACSKSWWEMIAVLDKMGLNE